MNFCRKQTKLHTCWCWIVFQRNSSGKTKWDSDKTSIYNDKWRTNNFLIQICFLLVSAFNKNHLQTHEKKKRIQKRTSGNIFPRDRVTETATIWYLLFFIWNEIRYWINVTFFLSWFTHLVQKRENILVSVI